MRYALSSIVLSGMLLSASALAAEPGTKAAQPADGNACTWISSVDDWQRLDDRNLLVWVSRNEVYQVELTMPLVDLSTAEAIGFVDHNRDGRICGFGMDEVVVPHSPVFGSATIANMTRLDDAGLQAVAERYQVKLRSLQPAARSAQNSPPADRQ